MFHRRQLRFIPAEDAKRLLQYQADPASDARLVVVPIAIMRARAVQALMAGRDMDIMALVNHMLASAHIFVATLNPNAWEMGHG
jgi:type IV secretory pathway TrbD component